MIYRFRSLLMGAGVVLGLLFAGGWQAAGSLAQTSGGCQTFPETGHKVCGRFPDIWR